MSPPVDKTSPPRTFIDRTIVDYLLDVQVILDRNLGLRPDSESAFPGKLLDVFAMLELGSRMCHFSMLHGNFSILWIDYANLHQIAFCFKAQPDIMAIFRFFSQMDQDAFSAQPTHRVSIYSKLVECAISLACAKFSCIFSIFAWNRL